MSWPTPSRPHCMVVCAATNLVVMCVVACVVVVSTVVAPMNTMQPVMRYLMLENSPACANSVNVSHIYCLEIILHHQ